MAVIGSAGILDLIILETPFDASMLMIGSAGISIFLETQFGNMLKRKHQGNDALLILVVCMEFSERVPALV